MTAKPGEAVGDAHHTSSQQVPTDLLCSEERKACRHFTTFLELHSATFLKQLWPKLSPWSSVVQAFARRSRLWTLPYGTSPSLKPPVCKDPPVLSKAIRL